MRLVLMRQPITPIEEEYSTCESSAIVVERLIGYSWCGWCEWSGCWCGRLNAEGTSVAAKKDAIAENDFIVKRVYCFVNE